MVARRHKRYDTGEASNYFFKNLAILYYNGPLAQLYFNGPGFFQQKPAVSWKCQNSIGDKWAIEV